MTSAVHRGDQRVELIESLTHSVLHAGGDGAVQRFLAGEQLVQGEARLPWLSSKVAVTAWESMQMDIADIAYD